MPSLISALPSVSIIVPTYKEAENLPILIPQIAETLSKKGWIWELIVVDDNSPDATPTILQDLATRYPQVRYEIRKNDRGLSSAVLAGISLAHHDYIVVMDADLSHPPESIPALVEPLLLGTADFVIGSRYCCGGKTESWSRLRYLNSWGATQLAKPLVGAVKDPMAGFFSLRRNDLQNADPLNPIGYKIGLELIAKTKINTNRVAETPITFRNRIHGESKLTLKEQFRYLEHLSRLYDYKFPKASPRIKFVIAATCGAVACFASVGVMDHFGVPAFVSLAGGMLAMILVTLAFFVRYVHTQKAFTVMKQPYTEFGYISMAEFIAGWAFAVSTHANLLIQLCMGLMVLLVVRYTLRKVFLHDLRGIRGAPRENAQKRLVLATAPTQAAAASA